MKKDASFILECPECETRYEIPTPIPEGGRKVRCAKCTHVWDAQPGDEIPKSDLLEAEDIEVVFADPAAAAESQAGPEPESQPEPEAESGTEPESQPEPEAESGTEPESQPEPEAESGTEPDGEPDPETEPGPETESEAEPVAPPEIDSESETRYAEELASAFEAVAEPAPAAEQETLADDTGEDTADVPEPEPVDASEPDSVAAFYGEESATPDPEEPASDTAPEQELQEEPEPEAVQDAEYAVDEGAEPEKIVVGKARRRRAPVGAGAIAAGWGMLCLAVFGLGYLATSQRVAVVRALPGTAWVYASLGLPVNVRGLDFRSVDYTWETEAGRVVLQVHGDIVNITGQELHVPSVIFALRDENETEVYQWEDEVLHEPLAGGDRATFAIRIPTPPKSIKSVQVRFAKAR